MLVPAAIWRHINQHADTIWHLRLNKGSIRQREDIHLTPPIVRPWIGATLWTMAAINSPWPQWPITGDGQNMAAILTRGSVTEGEGWSVWQVPHTDPSFVFSMSPPSPNAQRIPGLVDVVHRAEVDFEPPPFPPPGSGQSPAGGMRPSCLTHWWLTSWLGCFRPGRHPFLLGPLSPPYPIPPIALQWSEQTERASIQQKKNSNSNESQSWGKKDNSLQYSLNIFW